uniref:RNase H type-1 domain-containing protein n=1 Tax=Aegilops tauschii subsp. strangulata TaxID=200361 RepID=A0A452ZEU1_AEGTS
MQSAVFRGNQEHCCATLCGMWAIWTLRNKRYHGETTMNISQACRWAWEMAPDMIQTSNSDAKEKKKTRIMKWKRPTVGFVKVNVDASFNLDTQQGAKGVIIRDDQGQVIAQSFPPDFIGEPVGVLLLWLPLRRPV